MPVTITVRTSGEPGALWQLEARVGARVAVRVTDLPPLRVWDIVSGLGEEKLIATVRGQLEEHRKLVEARESALSSELEAVRQQLRLYPDPSA